MAIDRRRDRVCSTWQVSQYAAHSELPVVNQKCVRWHGVQPEHLKFVDPSQWNEWGPERTLRDGDILWNSTGTGTIGRAAIYRPLPGFSRVVADSHVTVVRVKIGPPEYLHAWIQSPVVQGRIDAMQSGSTNQVELNRSEVLRTRVPVAPVEEQHRIVAKIHSLQSKSRRARAALDAVPPLLEKLRQSILASAFRGDLTKDWRAKHRDVEPASELLKRTRIERRKKWEESELAKMKAKGKLPGDDRWKAKYREPDPVDTTGLPGLPGGWCWASPDELSAELPNALTIGPFGSDLKVSDYRDAGVPLVFVRDIRAETFGGEKTKFVTLEKAAALSRHLVQPGDLLVTKMGDPPGDTAVYPADRPAAVITADCIKLTPFVGLTDGIFLKHCFRAQIIRQQLLEQTAGVAQQKLSLERFKTIGVPLAPLTEQSVLISRLEQFAIGVATSLRNLESLRRRVEAVDRAMLAKAFRGKLMAQGANDK